MTKQEWELWDRMFAGHIWDIQKQMDLARIRSELGTTTYENGVKPAGDRVKEGEWALDTAARFADKCITERRKRK